MIFIKMYIILYQPITYLKGTLPYMPCIVLKKVYTFY